jgi:hypothetical protein
MAMKRISNFGGQFHGLQLDLILFGGCGNRNRMKNEIIDRRSLFPNTEIFEAEKHNIAIPFVRQKTSIPPLHVRRRWTLKKAVVSKNS